MVQMHQSAFCQLGNGGRFAVHVGNRNTAVILLNPNNLRIIANEITDFPGERLADHVHSADWLEHRGLQFKHCKILQISPKP
jgi:hypothetical protein